MKPYYEHAGITIYHGDAREILPKLKPAAVVTDPPFFAPAAHYSARGRPQKSWGDAMILGQWWADTLDAMPSPDTVLTFCDAESYAVFYPSLYRRFERVACVVWDKGRIGMGSPWRHSYELVAHAWNGVAEPESRGQSDVVRCAPVPKESRLHPVDKPQELLDALISTAVPAGAAILDPFMGGGSTLEAARRGRRRAIGIEIEERYCEIAAKRLAQEVFAFGDAE